MFTQAEARYYFDYNPETGVLTNRVKRPPYALVGGIAGNARPDGYLHVWVRPRKALVHRLIWVWLHGAIPEGAEIDHVNGIRNDNRECNLRLAIRSQNHCNMALRADNHSGIKGITRWKCAKGVWYWRSRVKIHGKEHSSYHHTFDEAVDATRCKRQSLHGDYACHG